MTAYRAIFNFNSMYQREVLKELKTNGYQLIGYKGATGTNQITTGLPTWFSESFNRMGDLIEIEHEPTYKVYVYEQSELKQYKQIEVDFLSEECALGSVISLNNDGSFTVLNNLAPKGSIQVIDNRDKDGKRIIVGLASKIMGKYTPFCAFYSSAQESINIEPNNKICLFTCQTFIGTGTVIQNLMGMGCSFEFCSTETSYNLEMTRLPWGIQQSDLKNNVFVKFPNQDLRRILNTKSPEVDSFYKKRYLSIV